MKPPSLETLQQTARGNKLELFARLGYAAKGAVYGMVGLLAARAAAGSRGSAPDARDAIAEIGQQPFGRTLLALVAVGLIGHIVWRFFQAIADPDREGTGAKAVVKRAGYAVSGLANALLALFALGLAWGAGGGGAGDNAEQAWSAELLSMPFGRWLLGLVGAVVIGVGVSHFYRVYTASFMKHFRAGDLSARAKKWATAIGRFGLAARGVTFGIIGFFLIRTAIDFQPSQTKGLGGALQTLAAQPYGVWLLGTVALGLIAYSGYCFLSARYRRLPTG